MTIGDWIEHRITLEAIVDPQAEVEYPRLTEQNKPRYRYCRHCKARGEKSIATWFCIECANNEQTGVFVCEAWFGVNITLNIMLMRCYTKLKHFAPTILV